MSAQRIVYLASRFPVVSETFIVRELDAVATQPDIDVELRSLFPAPGQVVHPVAARWVDQLIKPEARDAVLGVGWAARRHPRALYGVLHTVVAEYRRNPTLLIRALVTVVLACAHARDLSPHSKATHEVPPHIHAHYATYPALAAWVCRELIGSTYSFTAHAHDIYVSQDMLTRKVADAELVITISEYNRDLLTDLDAGPTPIEVVHCGIDTASYPYRQRRIPVDGPVNVLTVASLQEYKGHGILLRAIAIGGGPVDRLHLDLIGDGPLREDLEQLAERLGIADRVRFLGSRTEAEVREALSDADLFVLPSVVAADGQMEGLPVALMEALACGVPTVSTDLSGIPEIVIDHATGFLARPGDVHDLHRALGVAVERHTPAISESGRALVVEAFDLATTTSHLVELLSDHVSARPGDDAPESRADRRGPTAARTRCRLRRWMVRAPRDLVQNSR
ncbi:glycosyltransferase [Gordonia sp. NPDC003422]